MVQILLLSLIDKLNVFNLHLTCLLQVCNRFPENADKMISKQPLIIIHTHFFLLVPSLLNKDRFLLCSTDILSQAIAFYLSFRIISIQYFQAIDSIINHNYQYSVLLGQLYQLLLITIRYSVLLGLIKFQITVFARILAGEIINFKPPLLLGGGGGNYSENTQFVELATVIFCTIHILFLAWKVYDVRPSVQAFLKNPVDRFVPNLEWRSHIQCRCAPDVTTINIFTPSPRGDKINRPIKLQGLTIQLHYVMISLYFIETIYTLNRGSSCYDSLRLKFD